jgi:hypothetical protein
MNAMTFSTVSQRNKFSLSFKFFGILLLVLLISGESWGQLYWKTDGTTGTWTDITNWGTSSVGPFTNAWVSGSEVIFTANSNVTFATTTVDNITVNDGVTVTVAKVGTLTFNGGAVKTWTIGTGSTLTWQSQSVTANSTAGITKNGAGTLDLGAMTFNTNMTGGFTLNNGTVTVTGNKALGNGALNLYGGTLNSTGGLQFTPTSIVIGGDFILTGTGTASWDAASTIALGASTRTITNSITSGSRTFSGIISGASGSGLTLNGSSSYPISLTGNNSYDGLTTINGSLLILNASGGALKSGNPVTIGGGTLEIAQSQTIGDFSMTSGTLKVDAGQTFTITGTYNVSGGTINNQGTIVLQGSSAQSFPGSSTVINNGTTGLMTNLTINNTAGVNFDNSFTIGTLTINAGKLLSVNAGKQLTVSSSLTNNGTLTLHSSSSDGTATILTPDPISGTGTYKVEQFLSSVTTGATGRNWYVSSPVSAATSSTITTTTGNTLVSYNESTGTWDDAPTTLVTWKGYIAVSPNGDHTITFTGGTLNNGTVKTPTSTAGLTWSASGNGFNLVGNPYASYLNWSSVIKSDVSSSIWYRSKSTGSYLFQTYNVAGNGVGVNGGTNLIPPMQSFWVRVNSGQTTGSLEFGNTMRSHQDQTVASNRLKTPKTVSQKLLRLEVSNGINTDEAVIYFNPNASNGYDAYDSPKMSNADANIPEIYTLVGNEELVINGMTTIPTTALALGFRTGESKNFTIKASEITNMNANTHIILKDNLLNTEKDITDGSAYTFSSDAVNSTTRFTVIFRTSSNATGLDNNSAESNAITVYKNAQNGISINCSNGLSGQGTVSVFNTIGIKLASQALTSATTVIDKTFASGVYLVNVTYNGKTFTQKIIIN